MRKVILGVAVSLDNRIEGSQGEYDWCFTDRDYGMTDFLKSVDAIFYGRKSYEMMLTVSSGHEMFKGKTNYIFSRNSTIQFSDATLIHDDIVAKVQLLKSQPGKNIWLFGGAGLTKSLLQAGLVDELWLSIHPIVLGNGKLLFDNLDKRIYTELIETKTYDTGLVSVRYKVLRNSVPH
jgi:dihydrofolate reductase